MKLTEEMGQNAHTPTPIKNTLAKLENTRGIPSEISCITYADEGDKALLSFTLDRMTATDGAKLATFVLKNNFVSPKYSRVYSSGVLSSTTEHGVIFYDCTYNGATKELTVKLFPELSVGSGKISNQRVAIMLTYDAVYGGEDIAVDDGAVELGTPSEFTDVTSVDVQTPSTEASAIVSSSPYFPQPQTHTVTFNTNGGTPANILPIPVANNQTLGDRLPRVTRVGQNFRGWFINPTLVEELLESTPIRRNIHAVAMWGMPEPVITNPNRDNAEVSHADLIVTWSLVPQSTYQVSVRNLTTDTLLVNNFSTQQLSLRLTTAQLTPGHTFRVFVRAVESGGGETSSYERVFRVGNPTVDRMVNNIINATHLGSPTRRNTMATIAGDLLNNGHDPAFVAGMLGNVQGEGDFGQFENTTNPPGASQSYMRYMIENHDYMNRFNQRHIYSPTVGATLEELLTIINGRIAATGNNNVNMFGLGALQWTNGSRIRHLVENYIAIAGSNRITRAQVIQAELLTLREQLAGRGNHTGPSPYWGADLTATWRSNNANRLGTEVAARDAAALLTFNFLRPANEETQAVLRGNNAVELLRIMMQ